MKLKRKSDGAEVELSGEWEAVLCEPPPPVVHWRDVTADCALDERGTIMHHGFNTFADERYRRRKVQLWQTHGQGGIANHPMTAIIIEQKVTA